MCFRQVCATLVRDLAGSPNVNPPWTRESNLLFSSGHRYFSVTRLIHMLRNERDHVAGAENASESGVENTFRHPLGGLFSVPRMFDCSGNSIPSFNCSAVTGSATAYREADEQDN